MTPGSAFLSSRTGRAGPPASGGAGDQPARLRVLIVDDHPLTREGLRVALSTAADIEVIGEATTGEEAVKAAEEQHPDVVLMDLRMPKMGGIEATRLILARLPEMRVVLFTVDESRASLAEAINAGVAGYLLKEVGADELVNAVRLAAAGKAVIHPSLMNAFIKEVGLVGPKGGTGLSKREIEVLQHVAYGETAKETGRALGISMHTVKTHLERIFEKLGANDRAQAVAMAFREGMIE